MRVSNSTPRLNLPTHPRVRDPAGGPVTRASSGDASLSGLTLPTSIAPGGTARGEVTVVISPDVLSRFFDPDHCDLGLFQVGFRVNIRVFVNGNEEANFSDCIGGDQAFDISAPMPETEGDHLVEVELSGANSGNDIDQISQTVTVTTDNGGGDIDPGNGDNGDNGGGGGLIGQILGALGLGGDSGAIERASGLVILLIVVLLLFRVSD